MIPARWPREDALLERLLHVDPRTGALRDARIVDLPSFLRPGDVLVVNDAATLPGSLRGRAADGTPVEVRILLELPSGAFRAVLFDVILRTATSPLSNYRLERTGVLPPLGN